MSLPSALDLLLTGKTVKAPAAKKLGLVDLTIDPLGPGLADPETNTMRYLETTAIQVAKYVLFIGIRSPFLLKKNVLLATINFIHVISLSTIKKLTGVS